MDLNLVGDAGEGFRFALESSPVALILVSSDGAILLCNQRACRLFGAKDLAGTSIDALLPGEHQARHRHHREQYLRDPARREMGVGRELRARRLDGSEFPVEVALNPVQHNGQTVVLCSVVDISERIRLTHEREEILSRAMEEQRLKSLGLLAGGIAHDFNNLLVGILGNASLAASLLETGSRVQECLQDIESAARHASDLARQMLAYSGKGRFVIEKLDLTDVISHMSALLRSSIPRKVSLRLRLAEKLPPIEADVSQIRQVVMNLITNAVEAIQGDHGFVYLQTGVTYVDEDYLSQNKITDSISRGYYVFFEVSDNGCGMSEDTQRQMFEPFFTTREEGHGLGLSAVRGIVRGHGGTLKVYSELGKGTAIKILFPALSAPEPSPAEETSPSGRGVVLVVDDNQTVHRLAQRILSWSGFEVLQAYDGVEAIELFWREHERVSLILLDMTMPRMDGAEAFRELKKINARVPIILSSGFNEQETVNNFAGRGLAGFIQKPYSSAELMALIERTLNGAEMIMTDLDVEDED